MVLEVVWSSHPPVAIYKIKIVCVILLTLAKSIGWITIDANVAAAPPHTNGSSALAAELTALAVMDRLIGGADGDA